MSDKMRDDFEAWAKTRDSLWLNRHYWGEYMHEETQISWAAWQASRATLVVELPSPVSITYTSDAGEKHDMGNFYADKHFLEALTKAGVTVK